MSTHRRPQPVPRPLRGSWVAMGLLLQLAVAPSAGIPAATAGVAPGSVAPNFTKTALGGGPVSLSDFSNKVVVLFLLGYG